MKTIIQKLNDLNIRSGNFPNEKIDRELYSLITRLDMLQLAYNNLRSKPGSMTPGVVPTPETLDGMSLEVLEDIRIQLKDESFQFKPGKRVQIPKPPAGWNTRPLTIAPPRDKIIQEALRLVLNAIYEPLFSNNSHGFRPKRGCHSALKHINQKFQAST